VSETYHPSSTDDYHLSIAHLVDNDKYIYNKDKIQKGATKQPITSPYKTVHVVHKQKGSVGGTWKKTP
jgi:hypothetical protein